MDDAFTIRAAADGGLLILRITAPRREYLRLCTAIFTADRDAAGIVLLARSWPEVMLQTTIEDHPAIEFQHPRGTFTCHFYMNQICDTVFGEPALRVTDAHGHVVLEQRFKNGSPVSQPPSGKSAAPQKPAAVILPFRPRTADAG